MTAEQDWSVEQLKGHLAGVTGFPANSLFLSTAVEEPAAKRRRQDAASSSDDGNRVTHAVGDLLPGGASLTNIGPCRHLFMQLRNPDTACTSICRVVTVRLEGRGMFQAHSVWVPVGGTSAELFDVLHQHLSPVFSVDVKSLLVVPAAGRGPGQSLKNFVVAARTAPGDLGSLEGSGAGGPPARASFAVKKDDSSTQDGPAQHGEVWCVFPNDSISVRIQPLRVGCMSNGVLSQSVRCKQSDTLRELTMISRRALQKAVGGPVSTLGLPAACAVAPPGWPEDAHEASAFLERKRNVQAIESGHLRPSARICTFHQPGMVLLQIYEEQLVLNIRARAETTTGEFLEEHNFSIGVSSFNPRWASEVGSLVSARFPRMANFTPRNAQRKSPLCFSFLLADGVPVLGAGWELQVELAVRVAAAGHVMAVCGDKVHYFSEKPQGQTVAGLKAKLKEEGLFKDTEQLILSDRCSARQLGDSEQVSATTCYIARIRKDLPLIGPLPGVDNVCVYFGRPEASRGIVGGRRNNVQVHMPASQNMTLDELNLALKNRVKGLKERPAAVRVNRGIVQLVWNGALTLGELGV